LPQQRSLGFAGAQSSLGFCNLFPARPRDGEFQRSLIDGEFCFRYLKRSLGVVDILLSHRSAGGNLCRALQSLVLQTRIDNFGSRGFDVGARLGDLFRPAAVAQPLHHLALRRGLSHFWPLSFAQITATIRVMFGFLLLIIPGILWMLSYSLIVPAIVIEGQNSTSSLRRSRDLIQGYRGKTFCILLIVNLLQVVLGGGVGVVAGIFFSSETGSGAVLSSAMNNLLSIFLTPLGIIAAILLYYDMRIRKEGFDLEMLSRALVTEPPVMATAPTPIP